MPLVTAEELLADYCFYWDHTVNIQRLRQTKPFIKTPKMTPARLAIIRGMMEWCETRMLPPRQWLYTLFGVRRWMFAPKLERGHLCSEKHIPKFRKFKDYKFYAERLAQVNALHPTIQQQAYDPNVELSYAAELAKETYINQGRASECMEAMATETFGFHPASAVCNRCPESESCTALLRSTVTFDIVALRRKEISPQQAKQTAFSWQRNGN